MRRKLIASMGQNLFLKLHSHFHLSTRWLLLDQKIVFFTDVSVKELYIDSVAIPDSKSSIAHEKIKPKKKSSAFNLLTSFSWKLNSKLFFWYLLSFLTKFQTFNDESRFDYLSEIIVVLKLKTIYLVEIQPSRDENTPSELFPIHCEGVMIAKS